MIFLTGEAGIGKSRLIHSVRALQSGSSLLFQEAAPLSFEASQPYAFFRSYLRQLTGISELDSDEESELRKLAALSARLPIEVRGGATRAFAAVMGISDLGDELPAAGEFLSANYSPPRGVLYASSLRKRPASSSSMTYIGQTRPHSKFSAIYSPWWILPQSCFSVQPARSAQPLSGA